MPTTNRSKEMWSDDVRKLIQFLIDERLFGGVVIKDPFEFVEAYEPELRAAGPELKFLKLAVPDNQSPFGWKPTPRLTKYIYKPKGRKERKLYQADIMWELLSDYVFGYRNGRGKGSWFTWQILSAVGLLRHAHGTSWVTETLHNLFDDGYCDKRNDDGLPYCWQEDERVRLSARGLDILEGSDASEG